MMSIISTILLFSCNKTRENDPLICLSNADKRICRKWKITRTEYENGTELTNKLIEYIELEKTGYWYRLDSLGNKKTMAGSWYWLAGNNKYKSYERMVIQFKYVPLNIEHHILRLTKKTVNSNSTSYDFNSPYTYSYIWTNID